MEREIKFKIWDSGNKCWLDGDVNLVNEDGAYYLNGNERYKVCQYTGITDRNGKYVYEGDIISWTSLNPFSLGEKRTVVVEYTQAQFWCKGSVFIYLGELLSDEKCSVVGNIYENPELLKQYN